MLLLLQTASPSSSYTAVDWHQQIGLLAVKTGCTRNAAPSGQVLSKLLARAQVRAFMLDSALFMLCGLYNAFRCDIAV